MCCAACGTSEPSEKTPPGFWSMYLMGFSDIHGFVVDFVIFVSALRSPSRVRVCCAACGASEPSEKTPLEFSSVYLMGFMDCHDFCIILISFRW